MNNLLSLMVSSGLPEQMNHFTRHNSLNTETLMVGSISLYICYKHSKREDNSLRVYNIDTNIMNCLVIKLCKTFKNSVLATSFVIKMFTNFVSPSLEH